MQARRGPYRLYDVDCLTQAYIAVKEKGMSIRKAALSYDVPKTTLIDRLSGRVGIDVVRSGPVTLLSLEQEALLTKHIQTMAEVGYGYSRQETIDLASDYAVSLGLRSKQNPLTDRWLYMFLSRWPELNVRKPRSLEVARAKCATRVAIDKYFDQLNNIMVKYHIAAKPHLIYNVDEKGMQIEHKPPKIVSGKHNKTQAITSGRSKIVTLIGCVNAVGHQIPPYFVFPGARMLDDLMEGASPGAAGTVSLTGWSNTDVFEYYMKHHLLKYLPPRSPNEPVLILYDGHKSHVSLSLIEWAKEYNIILFVLPPHCSHLLQPLDVSCFGPLEMAWNALIHRYMRESGGCLVTRYEVARLASRVYSSTLTPSNIQSAFKKSGIYPFNRNVVPDHQIAPSTTFTDSEAEVNTPMVSNTKACETPSAEQFFEQRGGKILQNVQKAKKSRNTLSKIIGGMAITEDDILAQIKAHTDKYGPSKIKEKKSASKENNKKRKQTSPKASTSNSVKKPKKVLESSENCDSSDEEDVPDSEKCVVCKHFSPDRTKRPFIIIVSWGQCDQCSGWVHLSFCTHVKSIRRGDAFLCPSCNDQLQ
ncbi:uncharacterized protein LOC128230336 [Mya arenaria]|uniref:uncharacterized protein LOC128230336 n=1 Tax=Mya arenaria TaxID=6604 RepID=UPI0022E966F7|nr:uncharacterized protein LOC128230336 [Mya arenaria]